MTPYAAVLPSPLSAGDYADYLIHYSNLLATPPTPSQDRQASEGVAPLLSLLALFPSPTSPTPTYLALKSPDPEKIVSELRRCRGYLKPEWEEIAVARIRALLFLGKAAACRDLNNLEGEKEELHRAYESYQGLLGVFLRQLTALSQTVSSRPYLDILIKVLLDLRALAILADKVLHITATATIRSSSSLPTAVPLGGSVSQPQPHLEATARQLNKAFTACVADRNSDVELSRKWATYQIVAILFRTYFKLKSLPLCRNILRALAAADLPPLSAFPKADRVTFRYYTGMLHFLGQEYPKALLDLNYAYENCHEAARNQQVQILLPLIPLQLLLTGRLPSQQLLSTDPRLLALFAPFCNALAGTIPSSKDNTATATHGPSLSAFEAALASPDLERILVKKGLYLALEAFRPVLLRCVLQRLWNAKGKVNRLSFQEVYKTLTFAGWKPAALAYEDHLASDEEPSIMMAGRGDDDPSADPQIDDHFQRSAPEIEWLLGGLIASGYLKGYLSHERRMLVLSNTNPFPSLREIGLAQAQGNAGIVG